MSGDPFAGLDPLAGMTQQQREQARQKSVPVKKTTAPAKSAFRDDAQVRVPQQPKSSFDFMNQGTQPSSGQASTNHNNNNNNNSSSNRGSGASSSHNTSTGRPVQHPQYSRRPTGQQPSGALKGLMQHVGHVLAQPDLIGLEEDNKGKQDPYAALKSSDSTGSLGNVPMQRAAYRASKIEPKPFQELCASLKDAGFKDISITLKVACKAHYFTCEQLGKIFDSLTFGEERVMACEIVGPRLLDFSSYFSLLSKATTDDERNKMVRVFQNTTLDPLAKQSQIEASTPSTAQASSLEDAFGMARAPAPKKKSQTPGDIMSIFESDNSSSSGVIQPNVNAHGGPVGVSEIAPLDFTELKRTLGSTGFGDKTMTLKTSAQVNWFTCKQLAEICEVLNFSEERIFACQVIAPKLLDPSNTFEVLSKATFDDERQKMAAALNSAR